MTWMHKISSVTFSLEDSHKISQPKDVMKLSYELQKFVMDQTGKFADVHSIQPDGEQFDELTGTINWYMGDDIPEEDMIKVMQAWKQEQEIMGFQIQIRGPEVSGQNQYRDPGDTNPPLMVYRIDILKNGTEDYPEIPEMNIAQGNAQYLFDLLNIPWDQSGSMELMELRQRLATTTESRMGEFTQDPTDSGEEGQGVRMIDFGLDHDRLKRYLDGLTRIVDFGIEHNFKAIQWV